MNTEKKKTKKAKKTFLTSSMVALGLLAVGMSFYFAMAKKLVTQNPVQLPSVSHVEEVKQPTETFPKITTPASPTQPKKTESTKPQTEENSELAVLAKKDSIERAENFVLPMDAEVQNPYSNGEIVPSKTMQDWRTHNGVDFKGAVGDPVKAVNNGIVKAVYDDVLWGTVVEIDHGKGMICKYCGFGKGSTVSVGDTVKINDKVGNLGEIPIEKAEGPHLHFEVLQDGKLQNPLEAIGKA